MFWWEHAASRFVRSGTARRFGLITTNSVRQTFNRRVVDAHLHPVAIGGRTGRPCAATGLRHSRPSRVGGQRRWRRRALR